MDRDDVERGGSDVVDGDDVDDSDSGGSSADSASRSTSVICAIRYHLSRVNYSDGVAPEDVPTLSRM